MKKLLITLSLILLSANGYAATTTAKIDKILFVESSLLIYIYPVGGVSSPPACHGANGDYLSYKMSRPMAKEYVSALLSAMYANKTVSMKAHDDCIDQSVSATLRYFTILNN